MDYAGAVIFFAIGLGITLLVGGLWRWGRGGKGTESLPMRNGAVRVDRLASRGGRGSRAARNGGNEANVVDQAPDGESLTGRERGGVRRTARQRRRK